MNENLLPVPLSNTTYPIIMRFREAYYRKERKKWTTRELFYLPELDRWYEYPILLKRLSGLGQTYNQWECRWIFHEDYSYIGTEDWSYKVVDYRLNDKQPITKEYIRLQLLNNPEVDFSNIYLLKEDLIQDYKNSRSGEICFDYDFSSVPEILSSPREKFVLRHNVSGKIKEYTTDYFTLVIKKKDDRAVMGVKLNKARALTKEEFISKAREIHGDKYDYSEVEYVNNRTKVKIWCNTCQEFFWQAPDCHLSGRGCQKCAQKSREEKNRSNITEFIEKAKKVHGNKYDYSKAIYVNSSTKLKITCLSCGGDFYQDPEAHLGGCGCPECGKQKCIESRRLSNEEFLKRAREVHGDRFDYLDEYTTSETPIRVRCRKHNIVFYKTPTSILNSDILCPECLAEVRKTFKAITKERFLELAREIHKYEDYDYSDIDYVDYETPIKIWDNKLKEYFWQKPHNHIEGHGNPRRHGSRGEDLINRWLVENSIESKREDYIKDVKKICYGIRIDFSIEYNNRKVWIEYHGIQHYRNDINFYGRTEEQFKEQLARDQKLREYCLSNDILLVEVPYILKSYKRVAEFLDQVIFHSANPNSLINYKSLYKDEI